MQFLRLLALAVILALYALGFSLYQLSVNFGQLGPWVSWEYVHAGFSKIGQIPAAVVPDDLKLSLWIFWSIYPSAAILFFILFGLTGEAMRDLEDMAKWATMRLGKLVPFKYGPPPVPAKDDKYS
jgi:pheromone a factor receptor